MIPGFRIQLSRSDSRFAFGIHATMIRASRLLPALLLSFLIATPGYSSERGSHTQTEIGQVRLEAVDRLLDAYRVIVNNYVDNVDNTRATAAVIGSLKKTSGLDDATWENCLRNHPQKNEKMSGLISTLPAALECSIFLQIMDPKKVDAVADDAIRSLLECLDEHSSLLSPQLFDQMVDPANVGATGLRVARRDGVIRVIGTEAESSARKVGIEPNDLLLGIDGSSTDGMFIDQVIEVLRGPIGSHVVLTIKRGDAAPRELTVERQRLAPRVGGPETVMHGSVLIVRVSSLPKDMTEALQKLLMAQMPAGGSIVLDLRGNQGGLLDQAIGVSDVFLARGMIVKSQGRRHGDVESYWARKGQIGESIPLTVLIDHETAAGGEIIASALQDNKRAIVVGQSTAGAGTVQTLIPIAKDYALRFTTSYELRPNGQRLSDAPIRPDCPSNLSGDDLLNFAIGIAQAGATRCNGN